LDRHRSANGLINKHRHRHNNNSNQMGLSEKLPGNRSLPHRRGRWDQKRQLRRKTSSRFRFRLHRRSRMVPCKRVWSVSRQLKSRRIIARLGTRE